MLPSEPLRLFRALLGALLLTFGAVDARGAVPEARLLWSFHAGAPLAGPPGVGADGTVALGTVDGYVHALRSDGVFRYSYTVAGRVLFGPVVLSDGLVIVASDTSRLYALKPDGALLWEMTVGGGIASSLEVDSGERVWLRTGVGTVLAVSRRGGVVGFAKIGRSMTLGPAALASGEVLVASPAGDLGEILHFGQFRLRKLAPGLSFVQPAAGGFLTVDAGGLTLFRRPLEIAWSRPGVERVLCSRPLVTLEAGEVRWLSPDGVVEASVRRTATLGGVSACAGRSLFVAETGGELVELEPNGSLDRIVIGKAPVIALDTALPGTLLVTLQDGRLSAFEAVP